MTRMGRWAGTSTPLPNPDFLIRKQTQPQVLPGHGSRQSLLEEGAPQHSCSRPTLVVSVPTPSWPGASPPLAPLPHPPHSTGASLGLCPWQCCHFVEEAAPPQGHLLGKQPPLPVPLTTRHLMPSLAAPSLLLGQHCPRQPPEGPGSNSCPSQRLEWCPANPRTWAQRGGGKRAGRSSPSKGKTQH